MRVSQSMTILRFRLDMCKCMGILKNRGRDIEVQYQIQGCPNGRTDNKEMTEQKIEVIDALQKRDTTPLRAAV